jgi:transcriptional regulator with XRE-family HTH domain
MPIMNDTLNPETLRALRKKKDWSQDQLAEESKISKSQISRWERGIQVANIHRHNRERLCGALRVKWEKLTQPPETKDFLGSRNRVDLKADIRGSARTALTLVLLRYRISVDDVIDMAPLAFLILAERSLRARQAALDEAVKDIDAATESAWKRLPYLRGAARVGYDEDWIEEERISLKNREVFMEYVDEDREESSPFVNFLRKELAELGIFQQSQIEFWSRYRSAPDYEIPIEVIGREIGLDPATEEGVLFQIQQGYIDFREVLRRKRDLPDDEYRHWLASKHKNIESEIQAHTDELGLTRQDLLEILGKDQT